MTAPVLPTGQVKWRVYAPDADDVRVTFVPSARVLHMPSAPEPYTAVLDNGVMSGPEGELLALAATDGDPSGWTWTAHLRIDGALLLSVPFTLPTGTVVDLAQVVPVTESAGVRMLQGPPGPTGPAGPAGPVGELPGLLAWAGVPVAANGSRLDWLHNNPAGGYLQHLHTGPAAAGGALLALGVGDGGPTTTAGLLVSVKADASPGASGVALVNEPGTAAHGMRGIQNSAAAPLMYLEQTATGGAEPIMDLVSNGTPAAGQLLQRWQVGGLGEVGGVRADTGDLAWRRNVTTRDLVGIPSHLGVSDGDDIGADSRNHCRVLKDSVEFYAASGSPDLWFTSRLRASSNALRLQAGGPVGAVGNVGSQQTVVEIRHDGALGLFGAAPVAQPAAVPDTSGATVAALEAEVNKLKALLRSVGLMAT